MSHTKISTKILEVMKAIPSELEFQKINEVLLDQKLIVKTEYTISESNERVAVQGIVWHTVTVSCKITIVDSESDDEITYDAYGSGIDKWDKAISKAQEMARRYAWLAVLNISPMSVLVLDDEPIKPEPEIVVETPESKLIAQIKALWKWDTALFPDYALQRFKKPIEQLNISELSVLKNELENYGR